jgi:hypothetical protein
LLAPVALAFVVPPAPIVPPEPEPSVLVAVGPLVEPALEVELWLLLALAGDPPEVFDAALVLPAVARLVLPVVAPPLVVVAVASASWEPSGAESEQAKPSKIGATSKSGAPRKPERTPTPALGMLVVTATSAS